MCQHVMGEYDPDGNKVLVCQVGDLKPGMRFRTPDGSEYMITDAETVDGLTGVVKLANGQLDIERSDLKLGRDRRGRLYASRYLNPGVWPEPEPNPQWVVEEGIEDVDDAKNQSDKAYFRTED